MLVTGAALGKAVLTGVKAGLDIADKGCIL